jgi:hypothetical protein
MSLGIRIIYAVKLTRACGFTNRKRQLWVWQYQNDYEVAGCAVGAMSTDGTESYDYRYELIMEAAIER